MYPNIMKLLDEAIQDKYILLEAYRDSNKSLEKEVKALKEMIEMLTADAEGKPNETN